ncbi:MAG: acyl-CoA dehydrogenase [Candidatus Tectomicrobia bacterium]|uniref:Acyl-CoA dehydrogenase n=1 Tax=Tectimicrobiota bacterium TaxID=2528274 RepID=A0A937VWX2_UNCTE|nr:acyl-CoA dehydrogenase [Candidatus Tectomicrobia bacterium]
MDLGLTEAQEILKTTAASFLQQEYPKETIIALESTPTGVTPELFRKVAELGWLGILIPEEYGGEGRSYTDAAVLFEELGRGPVAGPYFSSGILGALTVLHSGTEAQKRTILPQVASGERVISVAVTEPHYGWRPETVQLRASRQGDTYTLNGVKLFVHDAQAATHLLCAVRTSPPNNGASSGITLLLVDAKAPGVTIRTLPGWMAQVDEVRLHNVRVPAADVLGETEGQGWEALEAAAMQAIPILCAYQVGSCQTVFDISVAYSRTRVQFGQPIGRFQRVQDHIVNIVNNLDAARWTTYEALWKLDAGRPAAASVHLAKAVTSEAYLKVCDSGHEVHAGVGVIREYGLTLHTQRSRTLYHLLGDARYHRRRLADAMGW